MCWCFFMWQQISSVYFLVCQTNAQMPIVGISLLPLFQCWLFEMLDLQVISAQTPACTGLLAGRIIGSEEERQCRFLRRFQWRAFLSGFQQQLSERAEGSKKCCWHLKRKPKKIKSLQLTEDECGSWSGRTVQKSPVSFFNNTLMDHTQHLEGNSAALCCLKAPSIVWCEICSRSMWLGSSAKGKESVILCDCSWNFSISSWNETEMREHNEPERVGNSPGRSTHQQKGTSPKKCIAIKAVNPHRRRGWVPSASSSETWPHPCPGSPHRPTSWPGTCSCSTGKDKKIKCYLKAERKEISIL